MKKSIYNYPQYYEIAFSYSDIPKEVNFLEKCVHRFSKIEVKNILEIACGPAPYLIELLTRGYNYTGLDQNQRMLNYICRDRTVFCPYRRKDETHRSIPIDANRKIKLMNVDMRNFTIKNKFDMAFVMLGSLQYILNNNDFLQHLNSVANCLNHGGIYVIDNIINHHWYQKKAQREWTIIDKEISVTSLFEIPSPDTSISQIKSVFATFKIVDKNKHLILSDCEKIKIYYPQEFLLLIKLSKAFEYVGSFEDFNINKPVRKKIIGYPRIVTILRKK